MSDKVSVKKWIRDLRDNFIVNSIATLLKYLFGAGIFPVISAVVFDASDWFNERISFPVKVIVIVSISILSVLAALIIYLLKYYKFIRRFRWNYIYKDNSHTLTFKDKNKLTYTEKAVIIPCKNENIEIVIDYDWEGLSPKEMILSTPESNLIIEDLNGKEHKRYTNQGNQVVINSFEPSGKIKIKPSNKSKKNEEIEISISIDFEYDEKMEKELYIDIYRKTLNLKMEIEANNDVRLNNVKFNQMPHYSDINIFKPETIRGDSTHLVKIFSKKIKPQLFTRYSFTWDLE